jgi:D-alanyl-D-alanine carboxypeptidase (penicillin-binding protein 5/6)
MVEMFNRAFLTGMWTVICLVGAQGAPASAQKSKGDSKVSAPPKSGAAPRGVVSKDPYLGAIVVDAASGKVLFEDNADANGYPASMLKLMDLLIILEKVEARQLSFRDQVPVSAKAAKLPESHVALQQNEVFSLDEMLYALMIKSANDAAVALAEKVGGSVDGFLDLMNKRARELGMKSTVFHTVNGLPPAPGQDHDWTTARDFAILAREVLKHPDTLRYTSTRERIFRPNAGARTVAMRSHNHLLGTLEGCDGLKTGYISASGYSIAATASRSNRRIIAIVLDSADMKTRDRKAAELINNGFILLGVKPTEKKSLTAGRK